MSLLPCFLPAHGADLSSTTFYAGPCHVRARPPSPVSPIVRVSCECSRRSSKKESRVSAIIKPRQQHGLKPEATLLLTRSFAYETQRRERREQAESNRLNTCNKMILINVKSPAETFSSSCVGALRLLRSSNCTQALLLTALTLSAGRVEEGGQTVAVIWLRRETLHLPLSLHAYPRPTSLSFCLSVTHGHSSRRRSKARRAANLQNSLLLLRLPGEAFVTDANEGAMFVWFGSKSCSACHVRLP